MQPINNVFDHPLTVGDAATLSLFRSSQCLGFVSMKVARDTDWAKPMSNEMKCVPTLQPVFFSDDTVEIFLRVTSFL